jgi:hypothetical protein
MNGACSTHGVDEKYSKPSLIRINWEERPSGLVKYENEAI